MNSAYPASQRGFTLLEILVVLMLVSLLTSLLIPGLSQVLNLRAKFLQHTAAPHTEFIQEYWFNQLISGMMPANTDNTPAIFMGTASAFRGLSLAPLDGHIGIPTLIQLQIRHSQSGIELRYSTSLTKAWELAEWPDSTAEFRYMDKRGNFHDAWPPTNGIAQQLPHAIKLLVTEPHTKTILLGPIEGRKMPRSIPDLSS